MMFIWKHVSNILLMIINTLMLSVIFLSSGTISSTYAQTQSQGTLKTQYVSSQGTGVNRASVKSDLARF
jgi:hypothetical protein